MSDTVQVVSPPERELRPRPDYDEILNTINRKRVRSGLPIIMPELEQTSQEALEIFLNQPPPPPPPPQNNQNLLQNFSDISNDYQNIIRGGADIKKRRRKSKSLKRKSVKRKSSKRKSSKRKKRSRKKRTSK